MSQDTINLRPLIGAGIDVVPQPWLDRYLEKLHRARAIQAKHLRAKRVRRQAVAPDWKGRKT